MDDRKRYTDLPDGLRDEQLKLIDKHISDFEFVSHQVAQEAVKLAPGETIETVRGRLADEQGYKDAEHSTEGAEMARLRDQIADKEAAIKEFDPKILEAIDAVMQAKSHMRQHAGRFRRFRAASIWRRTTSIGTWPSISTIARGDGAKGRRRCATKLLGDLSPTEQKSTAQGCLPS